LVEAMRLEPGKIVRLVVEKTYGLAPRIDVTIEPLALKAQA